MMTQITLTLPDDLVQTLQQFDLKTLIDILRNVIKQYKSIDNVPTERQRVQWALHQAGLTRPPLEIKASPMISAPQLAQVAATLGQAGSISDLILAERTH
jgi:hypothetical protein